jgi:hypothetical protein
MIVYQSELAKMSRRQRMKVYDEMVRDALRQGDEDRKRLADAGIEVASGVGGNKLRLVKRRPKLVAKVLRWIRWSA